MDLNVALTNTTLGFCFESINIDRLPADRVSFYLFFTY